jgi:uncharacterized protein
MAARTANTPGAPCWVDLMTTDVDRARQFYGDLFGWESEDPNPDFGGYLNFTKGGVRVAGCMPDMTAGEMPPVWSVYLASADATKTMEAVAAAGVPVFAPAMEVADLGTMAVFADTGGAVIGLWQAGTHTGFGLVQEPGAPSWFDLMTRDYEAVLAFYRDVFGWTTHTVADDPGFRYTVMADGEQWYCGVMDASSFLPEGVPPYWSVYFGTDDTDAAVAKVLSMGGSVVDPAEDTEYGRIATVKDPMGALFKLVASNEAMPA